MDRRTREVRGPMKLARRIALGILVVVLAACAGAGALYASRIKTVSSIQQLTNYDDGYNLYSMDVAYDYSTQHIIDSGITDNQSHRRRPQRVAAASSREHEGARLWLHRLHGPGLRRHPHGPQLRLQARHLRPAGALLARGRLPLHRLRGPQQRGRRRRPTPASRAASRASRPPSSAWTASTRRASP